MCHNYAKRYSVISENQRRCIKEINKEMIHLSQARFWVQAVFFFTILLFCMAQLFRQVEDRAVYIALLSAICGNIVPTIKQKKTGRPPILAGGLGFDEVDAPSPTAKNRPNV